MNAIPKILQKRKQDPNYFVKHKPGPQKHWVVPQLITNRLRAPSMRTFEPKSSPSDVPVYSMAHMDREGVRFPPVIRYGGTIPRDPKGLILYHGMFHGIP